MCKVDNKMLIMVLLGCKIVDVLNCVVLCAF